jgi:hypothetical protein
MTTGGCSRPHDILTHRKKVDSIQSSISSVADAWLAGDISSRFAAAAFERTFILIEQERSAMAASPDALADPPVAALVTRLESLSREVAMLTQDVTTRDYTAMRLHRSRVRDAAVRP